VDPRIPVSRLRINGQHPLKNLRGKGRFVAFMQAGIDLLNPKLAMTLFRADEISIRRFSTKVASAVGFVACREIRARERFTAGRASTCAVAATTAVLIEARAWVIVSPAAAFSASVLERETPAAVESRTMVSKEKG
jgi:hypothetical protein